MRPKAAASSAVGQLRDASNLDWKKRRETIQASWGDTNIQCSDNLFEAILKLNYVTEEGELALKALLCLLERAERIEGIVAQIKKRGDSPKEA